MTVSLSYVNTQASGMWDPRLVLGWSKVDIAVDQPDIPPRIVGPGVSRGLNKTFSARAENRFHLSDVNTITAGIDYYDKESTYSDLTYGPVTEKASNVGLYVQARLEPAEGRSTSFGLRWDDQRFTGISGWKGDFSGLSGNLSLDGEIFLTKIDDARDRVIMNDLESRGFNLGLGYGWEGGYLRASYSQSKIRVNGPGTDS